MLGPTPVAVADGLAFHDGSGPVAGMPGFMIERAKDTTRCGGVAVRVVRDSSIPVATADQPMADLLAVEYPRGLDFGDANRETSLRAFQAWFENVKTKGEQTIAHYQQRVASTADPREQMAATAHIVQVPRFIAGLIARAEIPIDMRTGDFAEEKQDAFCDKLFEASEPLLARADTAADDCAKKAVGTPGWWTTVCTR